MRKVNRCRTRRLAPLEMFRVPIGDCAGVRRRGWVSLGWKCYVLISPRWTSTLLMTAAISLLCERTWESVGVVGAGECSW